MLKNATIDINNNKNVERKASEKRVIMYKIVERNGKCNVV